MKKAILSFGVMMCLTFATKAQEVSTAPINPNAADMTFESEVIDYGKIEHNANGLREFKFKNTGKEPLIISNAVGSCGCTTPEWPKEPIKPGQSGIIKVKYDTNRPGQFEKTVTITSNAKTPTKTLKIKGNVLPAATAAPATPAPAKQ